MKRPVPKKRRFDGGGSVPPIRQGIDRNAVSNQVRSGMNEGMQLSGAAQKLFGKGGSGGGGGDNSGYTDTGNFDSSMSGGGTGDPMAGGGSRKGGPIKKTHGPRIGKEDGVIAAQRGEYVIRKSAAKKLGTRVLSQINKGRLPERKGKSR
jgi:hypothetical protein